MVTIEERQVHVFVVHLSPNNFFDYPLAEFISLVIERYGYRAAEVNGLKAEIRDLTDPVLLLCDCNLTDTSEAYSRLSSFLHDSFREVGRGLGILSIHLKYLFQFNGLIMFGTQTIS